LKYATTIADLSIELKQFKSKGLKYEKSIK